MDVQRVPAAADNWQGADAYEGYVGRWSRLVAREFLDWLDVGPGRFWLDVGSGTGALGDAITGHSRPGMVLAIDRSLAYLVLARSRAGASGTAHTVADGCNLPVPGGSFDVAVSGLVLNFADDPARMVHEMVRAVRSAGRVALYVWDYAGLMEPIRYFWDAAVALHPAAEALDEGRRFPICTPVALRSLFEGAGLIDIDVRSIDIPALFRDFDDFWTPFLGGQGPAPGYAMSLTDSERQQLRALLRSRLPVRADGSISLTARAWGIRSRVAGETQA